MKEYLEFKLIQKLPKTAVYAVVSKSDGKILGRVYWHWAWRQYIFEAFNITIWSRGCLQQIQDFIDKLMEERKKNP